MTNKAVSDYTTITTIAATDLLLVSDDGGAGVYTSKNITWSDFVANLLDGTTPFTAIDVNGGDISDTTTFGGVAGDVVSDLVFKDSNETITGVWTFTTAPVIATITNGAGTITLPTSTDTLVGRATTDTLTNKTHTSPIITGGTLNGGAALTVTSTELNILDAMTASTNDLIATTNFEETISATAARVTITTLKYLRVDAGYFELGAVAVTSTAAELNFLDGANVTNTRLTFGDGANFTSSANLTFDGTTLSVGGAGLITTAGAITGTLQTAAQPNITSLGILTTLQVDNIIFLAGSLFAD